MRDFAIDFNANPDHLFKKSSQEIYINEALHDEFLKTGEFSTEQFSSNNHWKNNENENDQFGKNNKQEII